MAEEKKKSWFRRHWILTTILVLIILGIIVGVSNSNNSGSSSKGGLQLVGNEPSNSGSPVSNEENNINLGSNTPSSGSSNTEGSATSNNYPCPDLSSMKLQPYDSLVQSWDAQVSTYKSGNLEVVYTDLRTSDVHGTSNIIYCDVGSEQGQNANWVYCGDYLRAIVAQYTDSSGNIVKKRSVEVTFDKDTKQYLATNCDTYELMD